MKRINKLNRIGEWTKEQPVLVKECRIFGSIQNYIRVFLSA